MNINSIIIKKQNGEHSKAKARQIAHKYHNHIPGFVRETSTSFRVRVIPKTKFDSRTFRTKTINKNVSIVNGKLKHGAFLS